MLQLSNVSCLSDVFVLFVFFFVRCECFDLHFRVSKAFVCVHVVKCNVAINKLCTNFMKVRFCKLSTHNNVLVEDL